MSIEAPVLANTNGHEGQFTVKTIGATTTSGTITCTGASNITCTSAPQTVTLAPGASMSYLAVYSAGARSGIHTYGITVASCGGSKLASVRVN